MRGRDQRDLTDEDKRHLPVEATQVAFDRITGQSRSTVPVADAVAPTLTERRG